MEIKCYCCDSRFAKWNYKYEKMLCCHCEETLERLNKYKDKISEVSQAYYNKSLHPEPKALPFEPDPRS